MPTMTTLVDGTIPVAADFNGNYTALNQAIGTSTTITSYTTGDMLYASATNKLLALPIGTGSGQTLGIAAGVPAWVSYPYVLTNSGTGVTISNSAAETTLLTVSVPANLLSTKHLLRVTVYSRATNTTGGTVAYQMRLKYGATTLVSPSINVTTGATNLAQQWHGSLMNLGATNSQQAHIWEIQSAAFGGGPTRGTAAEDSTTALNLVLSMQLDTASASATFTMDHVTVEVVR